MMLEPLMSCGLRLTQVASAPRNAGAVLSLIALALAGCDAGPNQVHFVLPDGYRGSFVVQPDEAEGTPFQKSDGRFVVRIPESGLLKFTGYDPFGGYLETASFVSGHPIWVAKGANDKPAPDEVGLWGIGTKAWYEDGKPVNQFYWFVGTEQEWKTTDGQSRYRIGGVVKEPGN